MPTSLAPFRRVREGIADFLPYAAQIDDGLLLGKDGSLSRSWYYRGPDLASATDSELQANRARLNSVLRRLQSGWLLNANIIRRPTEDYPDSDEQHWPDAVTYCIDRERQQQYRESGAHYESIYILTLTYLPPYERMGQFEAMLVDRPESQQRYRHGEQVLEQFERQCEELEDLLGALLSIQRMGSTHDPVVGHCCEQLRFLRYCLSGDNHPMQLPPIPMYLDAVLGCDDFIAGFEPQIGPKHIAVIGVDGYPNATFPWLLAELDELSLEYRFAVRWLPLDAHKAAAEMNIFRRKWRQKVRGFFDQVFHTSRGASNLDALEMTQDAERARADAESGDVLFGYTTLNVVLMNEDWEPLQESQRQVLRVLRNRGFAARVETVNAVEAWLGSLPSNGYPNIRRPLLHSLNLSDLIPTTAIWAGERYCPNPYYPPESPPLAVIGTTGSTAYRLNLHVEDVGHTAVIGKTGTGKSTLLAFLAAQFRRYENSQLYVFDVGYSMLPFTYAAGGAFYDISADAGARLAPLSHLETAADLSWAADYVRTLCELRGHAVTPAEQNAITDAIHYLAASDGERSLTAFWGTVQNEAIRTVMTHFTQGGAAGHLLDHAEDTITTDDFSVFEMEELLNGDATEASAVLLYLFRLIERRLQGRIEGGAAGDPAMIILDEGWKALQNPLFESRIENWLITTRKLNGMVILSVPSVAAIKNASIGSVIIESTASKILLPNPDARGAQSIRDFYETDLGLNPNQIDLIARAIPKREYYYVSTVGKRLINLELGPVALSFCGVTSRPDRAHILDLVERFGPTWPVEWLKHRGLPKWATYLEKQMTRRGLHHEPPDETPTPADLADAAD